MSSDGSANKAMFTPRETELLAHAMKCIKGEVTVDYELLAKVAGFKSKDSARVAWYNVRKKLDIVSSNTAGNASGSPTKKGRAEPMTPKKAKGESKKRKLTTDDEGDVEASPSPIKPSPSKALKKEAQIEKEIVSGTQDSDDGKTQSDAQSEGDDIHVAAPATKTKANAGKKRGAAKGKTNSKSTKQEV